MAGARLRALKLAFFSAEGKVISACFLFRDAAGVAGTDSNEGEPEIAVWNNSKAASETPAGGNGMSTSYTVLDRDWEKEAMEEELDRQREEEWYLKKRGAVALSNYKRLS